MYYTMASIVPALDSPAHPNIHTHKFSKEHMGTFVTQDLALGAGSVDPITLNIHSHH